MVRLHEESHLPETVANRGLIIVDLDIVLEKFCQFYLIHSFMKVSLPCLFYCFIFYFTFYFFSHCFQIYIFLPVRKMIIFELAFAVFSPLFLVLEECSGVKEN